MVFEIPLHDGDGDHDEEMMNYLPGSGGGSWGESFEDKLSRLFELLEERLANLDEMVSHHKGASRVTEEAYRGAWSLLEKLRQTSQTIDEVLRGWRIELAGDPMGYMESKEQLEAFLAHQRASLDRIGALSRRVAEMQARQPVQTGVDGYSGTGRVTFRNERSDYAEALPPPRRNESRNNFSGESYELQIEDLSRRPSDSRPVEQFSQQRYDFVDRQIAQETALGLGHIQSQMYEANQIFKNLASMVNEQGETIQNLETTIDNTVYTAKQAVGELRKAYNSSSYKFSLIANYGLPGFLFILLALIVTLYLLHLI
ncbi:T-SNARE domain-containing protein [Cryptosporidium felis]|nr:T-SNARE domain-containing protein [Cryptosporidium felis]